MKWLMRHTPNWPARTAASAGRPARPCGRAPVPARPRAPRRPGQTTGAPGAELTLHRERPRHLRARAVAGEDVDLARLHDELAAVVVEAEVARVERERDGPCLARVQRHALEPAQAADGLRDGGHRVVDVELHDLVTLAATRILHGHRGLEAAVLRHRRGAQLQVRDLERRIAEPVAEVEQRRAARDVAVA